MEFGQKREKNHLPGPDRNLAGLRGHFHNLVGRGMESLNELFLLVSVILGDGFDFQAFLGWEGAFCLTFPQPRGWLPLLYA